LFVLIVFHLTEIGKYPPPEGGVLFSDIKVIH
jgi:hypothetical protein